jgi:leucyl/phenylalanyl-tRNA--protein transferase
MPVFALGAKADFPSATRAARRGLLAVGGDLSPRRLLRAYGGGIFPWYEQGQPILWWSPQPRFVLFPGEFHRGASLRKVLRRETFSFTFDRAFAAVVDACARPRAGEPGTWLTREMRHAYVRLHELGYAHSLEARLGGELAGGVYGVSLGACFFAESMFHSVANASKAALAVLAATLAGMGCRVIDCQVPTPHLAAWGARSIPRRRYLRIVGAGLRRRTRRGSWAEIELATGLSDNKERTIVTRNG